MSTGEESQAVKEAAIALSAGNLVAFPTETVYGLGADAASPDALRKLFKAKGRPEKHPVIVHLKDFDDAEKWCAELTETAKILAKLFWPGPLTLVLKKSRHVLDLVTGGQDTVALRVPSHPLALELLSEFGSGVAAPSANKFGRLSPTCAEDVRNEFGDEVSVVIDGGPCEIGIESTIVDLSGAEPRILRPGMIQQESIYVALAELGVKQGTAGEAVPRVPGSLPTHYAPQTSLRVVCPDDFQKEIERLEMEGTEAAVLSFRSAPMLHKHWITANRFAAHYAHTLYRNLRKLDSLGADIIIVEEPPSGPEWDGIRDRIDRASGKSLNEDSCDGS